MLRRLQNCEYVYINIINKCIHKPIAIEVIKNSYSYSRSEATEKVLSRGYSYSRSEATEGGPMRRLSSGRERSDGRKSYATVILR